MKMIKFGWKAGAEQYPPGNLLDYAVIADQAGFDLLDVSDHFHPWSEAGQASFAWIWLGAAAARTDHITLGPGLTAPILRYHPSVVAQAAATLACLAPGRTYLAVGTGEALNENSSIGQWPGYLERQARLTEAIALIRALWTGDEVTFDGDFFHTRKARLYTRPETPIPLYVSSLAPAARLSPGVWRWAADGRWTIAAGVRADDARVRQGRTGGRQGPDPTATPD